MFEAPATLYQVASVTKELNGYSYLQKALVEDAKSETARRKGAQELWMKDRKEEEKGSFDQPEEDFTVANFRRKSLVEDAKIDTARNKEAQENWIKELKKDGTENFDLTEEEVLILSQLPNCESSDKNLTTVIFSTQDGLSSLPEILKCIEVKFDHRSLLLKSNLINFIPCRLLR
ncbi:uncharacterized protein LOC129233254 [Uloborus diversus]|uniref:uncharacterized protein LOC129233254 n=1 Tax=Uloborus diversus TaxID=327109 RepID=UPI0024091A5E|nr:uncharacterized protein LOC129233254 [Uloborus diversus]